MLGRYAKETVRIYKTLWDIFGSTVFVMRRFVHDNLPSMGLYILIQMAVAILPAILLWTSKMVIDSLSGDPPFTPDVQEQAIALAVCYLGVVILFSSARIVQPFLQAYLSERFLYRINLDLIKSTGLFKGLYYFESPSYHDLRHVVRHESPDVPIGLIRHITDLISVGVSLLTLTMLLAKMNFLVPLAIIIGTVPAAIAELRIHALRFEGNQETATDERIRQYAIGLLTKREYAQEARLFDLYGPVSKLYNEASYRIRATKQGIYQAIGFWSGGTSAWIAVWTGVPYLWVIATTVNGQISLGQLALYVGGIQLISQQVSRLVQSLAGHQLIFRKIDLMVRWMKLPPHLESPSPEDAVCRRPGQGAKVELRDIYFTYPGSMNTVLRGVSFTVEPERMTALVGKNGSGKTTLVKLVARLYDPSSGAILIDDRDIRDYDLDILRQQIAVVFQDFMRYDFTLRANISLGDIENQSDIERLDRASDDARLRDIVETLPNGYDTQLGKRFEGGTDLSMGQWQRVALARASFRSPDLIIMDEPTSALDILAETKINKRISRIAAGRTTLVISHRFSTIKMADKIIVLNKGELIEEGDHDSLMAIGGHYAEMYTLQAERYKSL